eukprot:68555-Amphidinium_carterae.2
MGRDSRDLVSVSQEGFQFRQSFSVMQTSAINISDDHMFFGAPIAQLRKQTSGRAVVQFLQTLHHAVPLEMQVKLFRQFLSGRTFGQLKFFVTEGCLQSHLRKYA